METIWIIGAGHFGRLAVKRIAQRKPDCRLVVVEKDPTKLAEAKAMANIVACRGNGIDFLDQYLAPGARVDWIIPCLPQHLVWEWCRRQLWCIPNNTRSVTYSDAAKPVCHTKKINKALIIRFILPIITLPVIN